MTHDEIIKLARQAGFPTDFNDKRLLHGVELEAFAKLIEAKVEARYMQLFLDPENQPTQFGTATQEYRGKELFDLKNRLEIAKKVWHEDQQRIADIAAKGE